MAPDTPPSSTNEILEQRYLGAIHNMKFRILILGRANAGKTTILERLAGASIGEAVVWRDGEVVVQTIKGQSERGWHDIDDEICFPSLPRFVFHDSRGFEAGSSQELSIIQKFVENRSSTLTNTRELLHAIWLCLPLDDSREFFETEKKFFCSLKGDASLVIIFTKRDGAIGKVTQSIVDNASLSDGTISRAFKKEARTEADIQVAQMVEGREEEIRQLGQANLSMAFLVTSDMQKLTNQSTATCEDLIKATEEVLTEPILKTLLCGVWGRNMSGMRYWEIYWILRSNGK